MLHCKGVQGNSQDQSKRRKSLVDSGATHCHVAEAFVSRHGLQMEPVSTSLLLATGASAQTFGFCTFTIDIQWCTGMVGAFVVVY